MNTSLVFFSFFLTTAIVLLVGVALLKAYFAYSKASLLIKNINPDDNDYFQMTFKDIDFSYQYTKSDKYYFSKPRRANLYWSGRDFILIPEDRFLPLGSALPIVFAVSTNPRHTKDDFPELEVYGMQKMIAKGYEKDEIVFVLKSASDKDLTIDLSITNLKAEQLAYLGNSKRSRV